MEQVRIKEITVGNRAFSLSVTKEDLAHLYPGFLRYTLRVTSGDSLVALFRTNTYEYAPGVPLHAQDVVEKKAIDWEKELRDDPDDFIDRYRQKPVAVAPHPHVDVVIVQASPRADGNSGTLAQWVEETVQTTGFTGTVLYPHDLEIHECIGCYQCFNTGTCIYNDDMNGVIDLVSRSRLLAICTPVYTNTVPANLKLLIDRFQAFFAAETLGPAEKGPAIKGIILSVSGRTGPENFSCIKKVLVAFMHTAGIKPAGEFFIDGVDRFHDIRDIPGCRDKVEALVAEALKS